MKEITGILANGRADLRLHPERWWSKESIINKRKTVSEGIHHLEEIRRIGTAVGQRKQGAWTKWQCAKERAVSWGYLKHIDPPKIKLLNESSLQHFTNSRLPSCQCVNNSQTMQGIWMNCQFQTLDVGML